MARNQVAGTFKISVTGENDESIYENSAAPYNYEKVDSLADIFEANEAALSEDQINFMGEVFSSEAQGKVVLSLIELYNDAEKSKAKSNAYQKLMNQYKPLSEDDKDKAFERAVKDFAKARGITVEEARVKLA